MMARNPIRFAPLLALALAAFGCSQDQPGLVEEGAKLMANNNLYDFGEHQNPSVFNKNSCADCHDVGKTPSSALINSGYTLYNVASRPSYWGGYVTDLLD